MIPKNCLRFNPNKCLFRYFFWKLFLGINHECYQGSLQIYLLWFFCSSSFMNWFIGTSQNFSRHFLRNYFKEVLKSVSRDNSINSCLNISQDFCITHFLGLLQEVLEIFAVAPSKWNPRILFISNQIYLFISLSQQVNYLPQWLA